MEVELKKTKEGKRSEELKAVNTDHTFKRLLFYRRGDKYLVCGAKGHPRFCFFSLIWFDFNHFKMDVSRTCVDANGDEQGLVMYERESIS